VIYEYLIYAMLDDNQPLGCEQVIGETERDNVIKFFLGVMRDNGELTITPEMTFNGLVEELVETVKYEDFKEAINNNEPTYNG
jgi:hypothetical protein